MAENGMDVAGFLVERIMRLHQLDRESEVLQQKARVAVRAAENCRQQVLGIASLLGYHTVEEVNVAIGRNDYSLADRLQAATSSAGEGDEAKGSRAESGRSFVSGQ